MCNPVILCRNHLLGEHNELHKLVGSLNKQRSIAGYIAGNCLEPYSIAVRHEDIAAEMGKRNYNHQSPLIPFSIEYLPKNEREYQVDRARSLQDLLDRCEMCKKRYNEVK